MKILSGTNSFAVLAVFLTIIPCARADDTEDLRRVMAALSQYSVALDNHKITARETSITFNAYDPISRLLADSKLSKQEKEKIKPLSVGSSGNVTNNSSRIYKFRGDAILSTTLGTNQQTKQIEERTLVTSNNVFVSRTFLGADDSTNSTVLGEIYPREGKAAVGLPYFLCIRTLVELLTNAAEVKCSAGLSSQGSNCYVLSFPPPTKSPVANYKLFVSMAEMIPVELGSYLPDGKPYSETELEYKWKDHPSFCSRAETRVFSDGHVFKQTTWNAADIADDGSPAIDSADFFLPGTVISDKRFAKPLTYTLGTRLPNNEEIARMLENPSGVVKYQLATHTTAELEKLGATRVQLASESKKSFPVRAALLIMLLLPPAVITYFVLKKRGSKPVD